MTTSNPSLNELLPLREPTFYILLSLASGEKHGYAIIKSVESFSQGKLKMSTGTLYEALARMLEQNLIERIDGADGGAPTDDLRSRSRKAYRLTQLGRRLLSAEPERLKRLADLASTVLSKAAS